MKNFAAAAGLAVALLALASSPAAAATLIEYEFAGQTGAQASTPAINVATGLTGLAFTRGAGLTTTTGANSINSNGFNGEDTDYYDFGFSVVAGTTATVSQLVFGAQASGTGPGTINILANIDGRGFSQIGSFALTTASKTFPETINLATSLVATTSADFHFVAANETSVNGGAIGGTGTFRVSDTAPTDGTPFTISGTVAPTAVTAVPEPAAWTMMIAGVGLAGAALRRRGAAVHRFA